MLATNLDTRYLTERPNLEVRVHGVLAHQLPDREFDLVHLRQVLAWVPDRVEALRRLHVTLKPGGVLLAEEMDFGAVGPDPWMPDPELLIRAIDAHNEVLTLSQLRDAIVEADLMSAADIDRAIALCRDGLQCLSPVLFAAWGYASAGEGSAATAG